MNDIEYELSVQQRKQDAKACMKHSAMIMNGELQRKNVGSFVGRAKNVQPVEKDKSK